ncbi:hypothetical protein AXF42_Ash013633 [Apostasia shenzhenica]|uniref:Uncharacterized protein n=1 Tax=Apostasia shenzhenica TaxID=1088818 RepID=A0A2I0APJ9_9ASPA|nr:hypothetical protein AXF42_Ash013633 [Apostasia shenzhenica]
MKSTWRRAPASECPELILFKPPASTANACDINFWRTTLQKLTNGVGEPKVYINSTFESHKSNVELKSHTLQLDRTNPPRSLR